MSEKGGKQQRRTESESGELGAEAGRTLDLVHLRLLRLKVVVQSSTGSRKDGSSPPVEHLPDRSSPTTAGELEKDGRVKG